MAQGPWQPRSINIGGPRAFNPHEHQRFVSVPPTQEMLDLAGEAIEAQRLRADEDIEAWAERLAKDFVAAGEIERDILSGVKHGAP